MWRALVFGGLSLAWLFSCSSSSKNTETVCNPKMTQACNKAGCMGVQECLASGNDWGPCVCSGTGGSNTGGSAGIPSGGTSSGGSGGTPSGGSGGSATGGVAGVAGVAGASSGGAGGACSGFPNCADILPCCAGENTADMVKLENMFEARCTELSGMTSPCNQACNPTLSEELTVVAACLQSLSNLYKSEILAECSCPGFVQCAGSCI
jgi:hypothetical protein